MLYITLVSFVLILAIVSVQASLDARKTNRLVKEREALLSEARANEKRREEVVNPMRKTWRIQKGSKE